MKLSIFPLEGLMNFKGEGKRRVFLTLHNSTRLIGINVKTTLKIHLRNIYQIRTRIEQGALYRRNNNRVLFSRYSVTLRNMYVDTTSIIYPSVNAP